MEEIVLARDREESALRLYSVERKLIWMRRVAMLAWGAMLYFEVRPENAVAAWTVYAVLVVYVLALHWRLRTQGDLRRVSWVSAFGDSVITFLMCFFLGKTGSVFIPFFYFTVLAVAFRFGGRQSAVMLVFNTILVWSLFLAESPDTRNWKYLGYMMVYLAYAFAFSSLLSDWAISNLRRALVKTMELESERDHSQELLHGLINAQEVERKKLAGDLHDTMGGRLFSISHGIDECIRKVGYEDIRGRLLTLKAEVLACTSYVRSFMNELRPTVIDEFGLSEAISEYVAMVRDVVPFTITTKLDPALHSWRSTEDTALFRLVQEALLNARKHSRAEFVSISLQKHGNSVVLSVEDDGRGFDMSRTPAGHFGLMTMRERAEVCGGILSVDSHVNRGTKISVWFDNHE